MIRAASNISVDGREKVWILEMNSNPLRGEEKKDAKGRKTFKFKGKCAEFDDGVKNENLRLYDRPNYDSKAEELYPKIEKRKLLGELDHNEDFLVSMKNASHVITALRGLDNAYEIEVELIPGTVQGNNAIALAEAGIPLHISSRASGYIDRNGNVTLERIYTYDIVSEPGFKNAELIPINEARSLQPDGKFRAFKNSNVRIYKYTEPEHKGNTSQNMSEINKSNMSNMGYASKADILDLKREIASLKKLGIRAINESLQVPTKLKYNGIPVEMLSKIPTANDVLTVDSVDFKVKRVDNIDESVDNSPNFKLRGTYAYTLGLEGVDGSTKTGYITKTGEFHITDNGISPLSVKESISTDGKIRKMAEAIEFKINQLVDAINAQKMEQEIAAKYIDGLSKIVECTVNEHNNTVRFVNLLADHSDNSSVVINKILESSDQQVNRLNLVTESLNATQMLVNEHAAHSDAQTQFLNALIKHSDRATKHLNMLHNHSDQLTSMVNVHESRIKKNAAGTISRVGSPKVSINESKIHNQKKMLSTNGKKTSILETTRNILAKVTSNKTEESRKVMEAKYPFTKQFTEDELKQFVALTDSQKQHVLGKLGANARKANIMEAIRYAASQSNRLEFLDLMPKEKKKEWTNLPTARKQSIIALFQSKNLRTRTAIEDFWDNIDLKPTRTTGLVRRVDESIENPILQKSANGYSDADMNIALGL